MQLLLILVFSPQQQPVLLNIVPYGSVYGTSSIVFSFACEGAAVAPARTYYHGHSQAFETKEGAKLRNLVSILFHRPSKIRHTRAWGEHVFLHSLNAFKMTHCIAITVIL